MQCAGEAKRNTAKIKAREALARFLMISVPKARYLFHLKRGGKVMKELNIIITLYLTTLAPTTTEVDFHGGRP